MYAAGRLFTPDAGSSAEGSCLSSPEVHSLVSQPGQFQTNDLPYSRLLDEGNEVSYNLFSPPQSPRSQRRRWNHQHPSQEYFRGDHSEDLALRKFGYYLSRITEDDEIKQQQCLEAYPDILQSLPLQDGDMSFAGLEIDKDSLASLIAYNYSPTRQPLIAPPNLQHSFLLESGDSVEPRPGAAPFRAPKLGETDPREQSKRPSAPSADSNRDAQTYNILIYKSLLNAPNHTRTLREIYDWFREFTNKADSGTLGWENSVRHNLSMNAAFIKVELPSTGDNSKSRPCAWRLSQEAIQRGNVRPTTRYRQPAKKKRGPKNNRIDQVLQRHKEKKFRIRKAPRKTRIFRGSTPCNAPGVADAEQYLTPPASACRPVEIRPRSPEIVPAMISSGLPSPGPASSWQEINHGNMDWEYHDITANTQPSPQAPLFYDQWMPPVPDDVPFYSDLGGMDWNFV